MLITVTFTSGVSSNAAEFNKEKESPLFRARAKRAIGEKIHKIIENFKIKFIGLRLFFIPFQLFKFDEEINMYNNRPKSYDYCSYECKSYYCIYYGKGCEPTFDLWCLKDNNPK
jgi:hypothetical protein